MVIPPLTRLKPVLLAKENLSRPINLHIIRTIPSKLDAIQQFTNTAVLITLKL